MIRRYWYRATTPYDPSFEPVPLGALTAITGASGSGKSRLFHSLFNLATWCVRGEGVRLGAWEVDFAVGQRTFQWSIEVHGGAISQETLLWDGTAGVERTEVGARWLGAPAPRVAPTEPFPWALRFDPATRPVHEVFTRMLRWTLPSAQVEERVGGMSTMPAHAVARHPDHPIAHRLAWLARDDPRAYSEFVSSFTDIFPRVESIDVVESDEALPWEQRSRVVRVRERGVAMPLDASEIGTGQRIALMVLTDLATLPPGWMILLDGFGAGLPPAVAEALTDRIVADAGRHQIVLTTTSPAVLARIPTEQWVVLHRDGGLVRVRAGAENVRWYGTDPQTAVSRLLEDPFFRSDGSSGAA